ncbi:ABC-type transport auxiliary lipoprotein component [compost metagenome]
MMIVRSLFLAGFAFALTACSILPEAEPVQIYLLPQSTVQAAGGARIQQSLRIARPQASMILDNARIAVQPEGSQINSYKGARWGDAAPALLRERLVEAFRADGRFAAVSSDEQHLQVDLDLLGHLAAFQTEYRGGRAEVVIRYDAHLASAGSQRILASRRFEVRQAPADTQIQAVVEAFGQASDQLARQLIDWSAGQAGDLARQRPDTVAR